MKIINSFYRQTMRILGSFVLVSLALAASSCAFGDKDAFEELFTGDGSEETLYVAVGTVAGNDAVYVSEDAFIWSGNMCPSVGGGPLYGVAYGNGRFVTSGSSQQWYFSYKDALWVWGGGTGGTMVWDVVFNERFVAVGSNAGGAVHLSEDGIFWTDNIASYIGDDLYGVTYGEGRFVAVGNGFRAYTSTDGLVWAGPMNTGIGFSAQGIAYGSGRFVAVGDNGYVMVSENGLAWSTPFLPGADYFENIAYGNGVFVAVGAYAGLNAIMYSTDGYFWIRVHQPANIVWDVTFCKNAFIAVGTAGKVYTSYNGKGWMEGQGNLFGSPDLYSITCRP